MPDKGTAARVSFPYMGMVPGFTTMPNNRTPKAMISICTLPQGLSSPDEDCLLLRPQQDTNQRPLKQSPSTPSSTKSLGSLGVTRLLMCLPATLCLQDGG